VNEYDTAPLTQVTYPPSCSSAAWRSMISGSGYSPPPTVTRRPSGTAAGRGRRPGLGVAGRACAAGEVVVRSRRQCVAGGDGEPGAGASRLRNQRPARPWPAPIPFAPARMRRVRSAGVTRSECQVATVSGIRAAALVAQGGIPPDTCVGRMGAVRAHKFICTFTSALLGFAARARSALEWPHRRRAWPARLLPESRCGDGHAESGASPLRARLVRRSARQQSPGPGRTPRKITAIASQIAPAPTVGRGLRAPIALHLPAKSSVASTSGRTRAGNLRRATCAVDFCR
jgi:hypothetical protein